MDGPSADSSAALSERRDQLGGNNDFDLEFDERRERRQQSKLRTICLMNELVARAADHRKYSLFSNKVDHQDLFKTPL